MIYTLRQTVSSLRPIRKVHGEITGYQMLHPSMANAIRKQSECREERPVIDGVALCMVSGLSQSAWKSQSDGTLQDPLHPRNKLYLRNCN